VATGVSPARRAQRASFRIMNGGFAAGAGGGARLHRIPLHRIPLGKAWSSQALVFLWRRASRPPGARSAPLWRSGSALGRLGLARDARCI